MILLLLNVEKLQKNLMMRKNIIVQSKNTLQNNEMDIVEHEKDLFWQSNQLIILRALLQFKMK